MEIKVFINISKPSDLPPPFPNNDELWAKWVEIGSMLDATLLGEVEPIQICHLEQSHM